MNNLISKMNVRVAMTLLIVLLSMTAQAQGYTVTTLASPAEGGAVMVTKTPDDETSWKSQLIANEGETIYYQYVADYRYITNHAEYNVSNGSILNVVNSGTYPSFTMPDGDVTITVYFTEKPEAPADPPAVSKFRISTHVSCSEEGNPALKDGCSISQDVYPTYGFFAEGTVVTYTANAATGWRFKEWQYTAMSPAPVINGNTIKVSVNGGALVTAVFERYVKPSTEEVTAVASVTTEGGETIEYASVEEAFEAVQNHDVLKLLADYNVPVDLENEKNGIVGVGNIYEQVFLTLDLNGHTLGFPDGGYLNVGPLIDLTVSGGTINGTANCIYNTGVLRLGNCTITATEGVGIAGNGELELHALPTFNCENEDIALEQDKLIYFVPGSYAVPEKKIKVSIKNTPPYLFTHQFDLCLTSNPEDVFVSTQYGDHAVGYCFFEGTYEAGIAGLTEITFPAGKSTYFDERALALYEANDKLKFYTVTDVDETNASVEVTEFDGRLFGQNAALIVSNETGAPVTAKFIEAFDGPMANYYTNLALDDLNGKYTYFGFEGTNVDLEEATDYEKQDPEKNYFYPIPGLTYYGFNGTGFVRLSRLGPIAAHRCWLGLGTPEVLGARSLTVNWSNGAPTGISDKGIVNSERFAAAEGWYGIDGRKLDSEPVGKGIYIRRNGNKAEKLIIK